MSGGSGVAAGADVVQAVEFEMGVTAAGVAGQDSGPRSAGGVQVIGAGMGVGEGEVQMLGDLPSIRA